MPELPDVQLYIEHLEARVRGAALVAARTRSPFVLRTVEPPLPALVGRRVVELRRIGKQIVFGFEDDLFLVVHLMIAGRFHWKKPDAGAGGKLAPAEFDFPAGRLVLTEASTKKRALTDPRLFAGIGNAYSDEILHRDRLSPLRLTRQLPDAEVERLHAATQATLREWIDRLRAATGDGFPEKVTAFRPEMAVHGRYRRPCHDCGAPVQRVVYAKNECNYCAVCQTGGKLLADRALSRLLKSDWPRTLEELEERRGENQKRA
jgi:formamidopyrimidine-DNA glycosylase